MPGGNDSFLICSSSALISSMTAAALEPGACLRMIDAAGWPFRLLERGNDLRAHRLNRPYGDQGIFVRRTTFEAVGGFPEVRFLEDLLLVRRLARISRPQILIGPIHTSARRWQANGIVRQTARNWLLLAAHRLGVSVTTLYSWLGLSDRGLLVIRGQPVTVNYFQAGPAGQGRIRIESSEVERLKELMRVVVDPRRPRRPPVPRGRFPGITVALGRPE